MLNLNSAICVIVVTAFVTQRIWPGYLKRTKVKISGNGWSMVGEIMKGTSTAGMGKVPIRSCVDSNFGPGARSQSKCKQQHEAHFGRMGANRLYL